MTEEDIATLRELRTSFRACPAVDLKRMLVVYGLYKRYGMDVLSAHIDQINKESNHD